MGKHCSDVSSSSSESKSTNNTRNFNNTTGNLSEFKCSSDEAGSGGAVVSEFDTYLGYNPPSKTDFNLLEFWKSQTTILPKLSAVARKVLLGWQLSLVAKVWEFLPR